MREAETERKWWGTVIALACMLPGLATVDARAEPMVEQHILVYGEQGKFAGWPANHGIWNWEDEILVGFSIGIHQDLGDRHNIDRDQPEHHVLARSTDGGQSWNLELPAERGMLINAGGMRHGTTDPRHVEDAPVAVREPINFSHSDFCMTLRFQDVDGGDSRMYYSYDRGHHWQGAFLVPELGQPGVMARTDYIINGPRDCHVLLTASKQDGTEGRVFAARTRDGGVSWSFLGYVGPEPNGFSIMPSSVRLGPDELLTTTRRREGHGESKRRWIDVWRSKDNGVSWSHQGDAVADLGEGNPPSLLKLQDGRLCVTYGARKPPYNIGAKFSRDQGKTWGDEFVLRTGGGGRDMGYVRTVQLPDGRLVTVYYYQLADTPYRQILATIWQAT